MSHSPEHESDVPYISLQEAVGLTQEGNVLGVQVRMKGLDEHEGPASAQEVIQLYRSAHRESMFQVIRPAECLGEFSPQDIELDERHQGVVDQFYGWTEALQRKIDRVLEIACTPIPEPRVISGNEDERKKEWALHMGTRVEVQRRAVALERTLMEEGPTALADKIRIHLFALWEGEEDVLVKVWAETLAMYYAWFGAVKNWERVLEMEEDLEGVPPEFQSSEYVEGQLRQIFGEQVILAQGQDTSEE